MPHLGRRLGAVTLTLIACALVAAPGATAKGKAPSGPAKVSLAVKKLNRGELLLGGLTATVRGDRAADVKVTVAGGLVEAGSIALGAAGTSTVTLRLTPAGRDAVAACGPKSLTFATTAAFSVVEKKRTVTRQARSTRTLSWKGTCG